MRIQRRIVCAIAALALTMSVGRVFASPMPIQHIVVIFQENVSFDHYFATYPFAANNNPNEPSFFPAPGTPGVNGLNGVLLSHNPNGANPLRLTRAQ